MSLRIATTGATGFLGGNLAIAAKEAGHRVVGLYRNASRNAHLPDDVATWRPGDLNDPDSLLRAFEGADVVYHCAAVISMQRRVAPWVREVNVEGTRNVLRACETAGVRRLVHCSTVSVIGVETDGMPATETTRYNMDEEKLADAYVVTKREAEELVLAADSPVEVVVVNPGTMFGPFDPGPSSGEIILRVAQGKIPFAPPGVSSFVDVRDVTAGMLAAAGRGRPGERYILAGHNLSYRDLMARTANIAGTRTPAVLPAPIIHAAGALGDLAQWVSRRELDLNSAIASWSTNRHYRFSSAKAEAELGYAISPLEPAIEDALEWFARADLL